MPELPALPADTQELRDCVRDLAALSELSVVWKDHDAYQIADSIVTVMASMLDAEFVFGSLPGGRGEPMIEILRMRGGGTIDPTDVIRTIPSWLPSRSVERTAEIPDPMGEGTIRIASIPIGFGNDAILVAASGRPDFPTAAQRILLGAGTNQAAIAMHQWRAEADERRFAVLIERSSDFVGVASLEGMPIYVNPAGLKLVGLNGLEAACQAHLLDYVLPQERPHVRKAWSSVMRAGRWVGEIRFRHFQTGAAIPFLVDWFRIDDPRTGKPINIATVSRDLTAQKRSEAELHSLNETLEQRVAERTAELTEANQQLVTQITERARTDARLEELQLELFHSTRLSAAGQMAAALAHELNQPLTAATNFVAAAQRFLARRDPEMSEVIREVMDEAAEQVLRAGDIIRRLRDFVSRGEAEKQAESVTSMVEEASALAMTGAEALGITLNFRFDPNVSEAFADRIQIQQVLTNLMRNALEAMVGSKRRELLVVTRRLDEETVEIVVADSGPGLSKDVAKNLFEPFISTKRNGMGLGLSICRLIVEAHGGKLRSEASKGGGATFRFTLPAMAGGDDNNVK
ncbi:MAG: domain S-box-containing protein [Rhodospirillales bacterium]|nr:domain S-box-containing protein [Rhodospirillales bacterium]